MNPIARLGSVARSPAFGRLLPVGVLLVVPAILILPQLGSGRFLFGHDVTLVYYQAFGMIGRALASGHLPVWNPHVACGEPALAAIHYALLYPPTWLCALLGPGAFWTLSVALHLALTGLFSYAWLCRGLSIGRAGALAGASMVMLSGFSLTHVFGGHLAVVCTVPWACAALWRLERLLAGPGPKRFALLGVCLTLMLLAGHPQTALIAGLALAARLAHFLIAAGPDRRERLRTASWAAAALTLGAALAAPQLLPTFELTRHTQRSGMDDFAFSSSYSVPPEGLLTWIAPTFFGDSTTVPYWGRWIQWDVTGFLGISALALAALGGWGRHPQRFLWLGLSGAGLLLSMGHHTPVFRLFFQVVPGAALFRVPARYLLLFTLGMAPLVALGIERLRSGDERIRKHVAVGAAVAGILLALAGAGWAALGPSGTGESRWESVLEAEARAARGQREETYLRGPVFEESSRRMALHSLAIASLTLGAVLAALLACRWFPPARSAAALGLLLGVELLAFGARFITDHPDSAVRWPPGFVEYVRSLPGGPARVATITDDQIDSAGKCELAGLDHVGAYSPMLLRTILELERAGGGEPAAGYAALVTPRKPSRVFDLLGARVWVIPGPKQTPPGWIDAGSLGAGSVYENPRALPRAFLVHRCRVIPTPAERLAYLAGGRFDPAGEVVLESGTEESAAPGGPADSVVIRGREPGRYELEAACGSDGWLVLSEAAYPGWEARVDGAPAEILRADHALQALRLSRGRHAVEFSYRSRTLGPGLAVAAAGALVGAGLMRLLRRRPSPPGSGAGGS